MPFRAAAPLALGPVVADVGESPRHRWRPPLRALSGLGVAAALWRALQIGVPPALIKDVPWLNRGTETAPPFGVEEATDR